MPNCRAHTLPAFHPKREQTTTPVTGHDPPADFLLAHCCFWLEIRERFGIVALRHRLSKSDFRPGTQSREGAEMQRKRKPGRRLMFSISTCSHWKGVWRKMGVNNSFASLRPGVFAY